jgi:voltage-gated potassium channel
MKTGRKEGKSRRNKNKKSSSSVFRKIKNIYLSFRKENLPKLIFFVIVIVLLGGFLIYFVERGKVVGESEEMFDQFFDGLWWTVVTITSVGYGDKYPLTEIGKIFAIFLMLIGVIVTSILSGTIASIFVDKKIKEDRGLQSITTKNHIVICGWNNNAENILEGLSIITKDDLEVVLISEIDSEQFQAVKMKFPDISLNFVRGDFTNEKVLRRGSLHTARAAIVLSDNSGSHTIENADERTILSTLAIKSINSEIITSAELINPENRQHLIRAKVDEILVNGEFNGFLLSSSAFSSGIPLLVKSMLNFESKNILKQIQVPSSFIGKPFKELLQHFFAAGKGILIGFLCAEKKITLDDLLSEESDAIDAFIKRKFMEAEVDLLEEEIGEGKILLNPEPDYIIKETDTAFVIGTAD